MHKKFNWLILLGMALLVSMSYGCDLAENEEKSKTASTDSGANSDGENPESSSAEGPVKDSTAGTLLGSCGLDNLSDHGLGDNDVYLSCYEYSASDAASA